MADLPEGMGPGQTIDRVDINNRDFGSVVQVLITTGDSTPSSYIGCHWLNLRRVIPGWDQPVGGLGVLGEARRHVIRRLVEIRGRGPLLVKEGVFSRYLRRSHTALIDNLLLFLLDNV